MLKMILLLVPVVLLEFGLLGYTLHHILTHTHYRRGNRTLWIVISIIGMQFIGPILYFALGKDDNN